MNAGLVWDADRDFLALYADEGARRIATAQRLDPSRWVAIVCYDTPGAGAACVRSNVADARAWIEETVVAAWPEWRGAVGGQPRAQ